MPKPSPEATQLKIDQEQDIALTHLRHAQAAFYNALAGLVELVTPFIRKELQRKVG